MKIVSVRPIDLEIDAAWHAYTRAEQAEIDARRRAADGDPGAGPDDPDAGPDGPDVAALVLARLRCRAVWRFWRILGRGESPATPSPGPGSASRATPASSMR